MKKLSSAEIRQMWLDFFASKGHMVEPGAPLVPINDPTLLWINSGVAALKKYFDGREKPANPRIVNAQKSIRTNDIENVGHTARHHTFFEMLGNFSIGDYFRKEAIEWAWELLTSPRWFNFDAKLLYMTVHPNDHVTRNEWIRIGVDPAHIIPVEGNFWEIGEGPCGPNTEIFVDRGSKYDPKNLGIRLLKDDISNDRYIEIWNIVFSQYNAKEGLKREEYPELPQKNIDTGAGLERITCIFQDGETNFDTDLFLPMIRMTESLSKVAYDSAHARSFRVIADHIRTCTFAIADGATFSNEGRGYVLRRLLRRAVRYGKKLNLNEAFMYRLVPVVAATMKSFYGYLEAKVDYIQRLVKAEEERFLSTISQGEQMLKDFLESPQITMVPGALAFKLYDTYGFPIELTIEMAEERGLKVDLDGFKSEMNQQKERARQARTEVQSMQRQSKDLLGFEKPSRFVYQPFPLTSKVIGLFVDGIAVESADGPCQVIVDQTNFYAESGGQVADTGTLTSSRGVFTVIDVQKAPHKQHLHFTNGTFAVGDEVRLDINVIRRQRITRHHSAVHLLHQVLRDVLGTHVQQAGSYVDDQRLRFDFSHYAKISPTELMEIEKRVNSQIDLGLASFIHEMPIDEAKKKGAMALFGEKYGQTVRVVEFGQFSIELCGGCHVENTSAIGSFIIESEESISSGVRRIQAVVGQRAYQVSKQREELLQKAATQLGTQSIYEVNDRLAAQINQWNDLKKQLTTLKEKNAINTAQKLLANLNVEPLLKEVLTVNGVDKDELNMIADYMKSHLKSYRLVLISPSETQLSLIALASQDQVVQGFNSGKLMKEATTWAGGSGGGRPDIAQGGVKDTTKQAELIAFIKGKL